MSVVALSELLGATVRDATGAVRGRVRELAIVPLDHPTRIAYLIVRTAIGERVLPLDALKSAGATVRASTDAIDWEPYTASDGLLLLKRDLLDQQIIDVHGRKVVRVNDVELESTPVNSHLLLNVVSVDVGARGGLDDQEGDAGWMILRRDGDFAHASPHGAGGIAHGGAEEFGQGDE